MEYTQEQIDQAFKLIEATQGILRKCDEGIYVKNVFEQTAIWDDTECDGYCLKEEIDELLQEIED